MPRVRPQVSALLLTLALVVTGAVASPATAAAPSARLTVAYPTVAKGEWQTFSYRSSGVPKKAVASLHRYNGTKWLLVKTLGAHRSGSAKVKLTTVGAWKWRVVYKVGSKKVATSKAVKVRTLGAAAVALKGVTTRIDTGKSATFSFTTKNVPTGAKVVLQRKVGTPGAWKTVKALAGRSGTVAAPALTTLGRYPYRAVVLRGSSALAKSATVNVYAYGKVPLMPFGRKAGTVQVGDSVFTYTDQGSANQYPSYYQHATFENGSTCRAVTLRFAGNDYQQKGGQTTYAKLVQSSRDPVYASVPAGQVGTLSSAWDGGPLYINLATTDDYFGYRTVVTNITGSCWTDDGLK